MNDPPIEIPGQSEYEQSADNAHTALEYLQTLQNTCDEIIALLPNYGTDGKKWEVISFENFGNEDFESVDDMVLSRAADPLTAVVDADKKLGFVDIVK